MANNLQQYQQVQEGVQVGSGLTRYRSAPSSYLSSFLDNPGGGGGFGSDDFERLFNPRASSPETQRIFSRFMNGGDTVQQRCSGQMNAHFLQPTKVEPTEVQSNDYSTETCSQVMYHQSRDVSEAADSSSVDNRLFGSFESNRVGPLAKMQRPGGACSSGLVRHSSSPAGLFANINIDEFGTVRAVGNIGGGNIANAEATFCSTSRFNRMDPITEITSKEMGEIGSADDDVDYIKGFSMNSWEDDFHEQKIEGGNRTTTRLSHHLSLPKSSAELSAMEKMLQDSVPCRTRAKRGCATHPRSIAERVRRTKISERMRKLQELVPNMEKQTNTSDMLDLAVEYIKDLQRQVTALSDSRAKCSCEAKLGL